MGNLTGGKNRLAAWSKDNDLGLTTEDCVALHARKMEIFEEDMRAGLDVRPGVIELLNAARAAGVKTAWVTTTPEGPMKAQLEGMKGLTSLCQKLMLPNMEEESQLLTHTFTP